MKLLQVRLHTAKVFCLCFFNFFNSFRAQGCNFIIFLGGACQRFALREFPVTFSDFFTGMMARW